MQTTAKTNVPLRNICICILLLILCIIPTILFSTSYDLSWYQILLPMLFLLLVTIIASICTYIHKLKQSNQTIFESVLSLADHYAYDVYHTFIALMSCINYLVYCYNFSMTDLSLDVMFVQIEYFIVINICFEIFMDMTHSNKKLCAYFCKYYTIIDIVCYITIGTLYTFHRVIISVYNIYIFFGVFRFLRLRKALKKFDKYFEDKYLSELKTPQHQTQPENLELKSIEIINELHSEKNSYKEDLDLDKEKESSKPSTHEQIAEIDEIDYIMVGSFKIKKIKIGILLLVLKLVICINSLAAVIMFLEYPCKSVVSDFLVSKCNENFQYFHNCLYFIIITITTIGYGDIVPVTTQGRLFIACTVVICVIWLPLEITKISNLVQKNQSKTK